LACVLYRHVGVSFEPGLEEPAMFRLPAYDPLVIAWLGIGVLAVTALAAYALAKMSPPRLRVQLGASIGNEVCAAARTLD
jgi:hypothetical protein